MPLNKNLSAYHQNKIERRFAPVVIITSKMVDMELLNLYNDYHKKEGQARAKAFLELGIYTYCRHGYKALLELVQSEFVDNDDAVRIAVVCIMRQALK